MPGFMRDKMVTSRFERLIPVGDDLEAMIAKLKSLEIVDGKLTLYLKEPKKEHSFASIKIMSAEASLNSSLADEYGIIRLMLSLKRFCMSKLSSICFVIPNLIGNLFFITGFPFSWE